MRKINLYREMIVWRDYNCTRHPDRWGVEHFDTGESRCCKCVEDAKDE